jgi:hypothetical protein
LLHPPCQSQAFENTGAARAGHRVGISDGEKDLRFGFRAGTTDAKRLLKSSKENT